MANTLFDYLVLDPEPYNEKYGNLGDSLTDKQLEALSIIADNPETLKLTVPEFLEEEQYIEGSRHWLRTLLYRFPAAWFQDEAKPTMDSGAYKDWFDNPDRGKRYPWSESGYVCTVEECGFETHWNVEAKRHEDVNGSTSYGAPQHEVRNLDVEEVKTNSGGGRRSKWADATVKELLLEHSEPYKQRWGSSPRISEETLWPLKDVPRLQVIGHDISYDMTLAEFAEAIEAINEERRQRDADEDDDFEANIDDDSILYEAWPSDEKYARKMLLRLEPGATSRTFRTSEAAEPLQDEERTLQFVDGWAWVCDCGEVFDSEEAANQHRREERGDIDSDEYWAHEYELTEVEG